MRALPSRIDRTNLHVTGVSCPDCCGVLGVRTEGRESLMFECRVGHTYDVAELLAAKEEVLEERLWTAITSLEELITLLGELAARASQEDNPAVAETYRRREEVARVHVRAVRDVVKGNRPVDLSPVEPGRRGEVDRPPTSSGAGPAARGARTTI
jgi:hypothetical protein